MLASLKPLTAPCMHFLAPTAVTMLSAAAVTTLAAAAEAEAEAKAKTEAAIA